jgi:hypothetical protein
MCRVGREVAGVHGAKRGVDGVPAGIGLATARGVAGGAVASAGQVGTALHLLSRRGGHACAMGGKAATFNWRASRTTTARDSTNAAASAAHNKRRTTGEDETDMGNQT